MSITLAKPSSSKLDEFFSTEIPSDSSVPRDQSNSSPPKDRAEYEGDYAIRLYLREIGQVSLLTPEEEIKLAIRIQKGDEVAREKMIKANLRLVVKIAHDYEGLGLPLLDLINEGNIGLMKAIERFDPNVGSKLSTYAAWWIKQAIKRSLANQSRTIRLPVHLIDKISKLRRTEAKMQELLGRPPTDHELSDEMGMSPRRIARIRVAATCPTSLDTSLFEDAPSVISDRGICDTNAQNPYAVLKEKTMSEMLERLLSHLPDREAKILDYRFGLSGGPERTLEEVGAQFGVTRERVRQLQKTALAKLRSMIEELESVQKVQR